jgi:predicted TIM-barrel fold metal-dependent hydrolase
MRCIGVDRFLFGSDYNVLTPAEAASFIERLGLTEEEQDLLRQNCAPWVCPDTAQALGY